MSQVNNRYREYRVAVPAAIAKLIKERAAEQKTTELVVIRQLIARGLVTVDKTEPEEVQAQ